MKVLLKLCNKYACRFIKEGNCANFAVMNKFAKGKLKEAFELLERCKTTLNGQLNSNDEDLNRIRLSVNNNLSVYAYKYSLSRPEHWKSDLLLR